MTPELVWELVWETPPDSHSGRQQKEPKYGPIRLALRSRPGEWARVLTFDNATQAAGAAQRLRRNLDYEAVSRRMPEDWAVFARYIGTSNGEGK